jgi:competence protein ComGC
VCVSHMGRVFSITLRIMLSRCGPRGVWFLCFLQIIELLSGFWNVDILFESSILFLLILPGAEERAQKEVAEKEQELLRQKQKEQQEYMEAQEKRNKENLEQLRRKLMQEREQDIKDHDMMLEKQLKVEPLILLLVLVHQPGHGMNTVVIYYC